MRAQVLLLAAVALPAVWGTIVAWGMTRLWPRKSAFTSARLQARCTSDPVDYQI